MPSCITHPDLADGTKGSFFNTYDIPLNYIGPQHRSVTVVHVVVLRGECGAYVGG